MRVLWAIPNLKSRFKALGTVFGAVLFAWAFWKSNLLTVLGQDRWFDMTMFVMMGSSLIVGFFVGSLVYDAPLIDPEVISRIVKKAVDENMKDLTSQIMEEVKKERQFQRVNPK